MQNYKKKLQIHVHSKKICFPKMIWRITEGRFVFWCENPQLFPLYTITERVLSWDYAWAMCSILLPCV